jgi:hypothetical protein
MIWNRKSFLLMCSDNVNRGGQGSSSTVEPCSSNSSSSSSSSISSSSSSGSNVNRKNEYYWEYKLLKANRNLGS